MVMEWALQIGGRVAQPLHLTLDDLRQYPAYTVATTFLNDDRTVSGDYAGVRVWDLLAAAGVMDDAGALGSGDERRELRVEARAGDGFRCLLRWSEIDPARSERGVLVAWLQQGQLLAPEYGPLRLIVPGDVRGRRHLRGLASLTVLDPRPTET